ncbi:unnamed protein product (macronuclear) [Paramecium tetraurelia]|uniref:LITAF domain-containing protein n=1 Tax=Paramecium tetraurelia TaxID=5888 RepID=A0BW47_PARTE|nr:uncharacterized protein GSPATT00032616001 [Paramecium tetraurelia]CAK62764.1 unnamed protein product [Paramecium tetraurelia]|eukprot:XP_001430162.1 hypothetical protein (macronuclear) [Paramecium tetraurelia strain d4-2]
MFDSDQHNQQTSYCQSQGFQQTIKPVHVELSVGNKQIEENAEYPKVPQSRSKEQLLCTKCNQLVETDVLFEMGKCSYIVMFILLAFIITAVFAILPCVWDRCKDAQHRCSKCTKLIGTKQFLCG